MKRTTKQIMAGIAGIAAATTMGLEGYALSYQSRQIGQLQANLQRTEENRHIAEENRDDYRRMLIQHGNPEGWQLSGDSYTGEVYYTRWNGDALGSVWEEQLPYK